MWTRNARTGDELDGLQSGARWCRLHHFTPSFHPMTERIRLTITVPSETHQVFQNMSIAAGQPLGRVMGDWLADTADAAGQITTMILHAKQAPKRVMRELQTMSRGLVHDVDALTDELRSTGWKPKDQTRASTAETSANRSPAPSSNTGLKSPPTTLRKGRKNVQ